MAIRTVRNIALVTLMAAAIGCTRSNPDNASTNGTPMEDSKYLLADEPAGAEDVIRVRETAQDQDEVVIVGRIGGSENPWVDGMAAFSIVDPSLKACSDIEGDNCPKPWDYCCETSRLKTSTALVKLVDEDGSVVQTDARQLLHLQELQTVVLRGTAQRDDVGNLTVLATGVYVRK